jgi:hypothetical protein
VEEELRVDSRDLPADSASEGSKPSSVMGEHDSTGTAVLISSLLHVLVQGE